MIQSLLTQDQYDQCSRIYNTYNVSKRRSTKPFRETIIDGKEFTVGPPPNYIMGDSFTKEEIEMINKKIEKTLKDNGLMPKHDSHRL